MQWPYIESLRTVGWPEEQIPTALEAALREKDAELRKYREGADRLPWDRPELEGWDIVGMNHYHVDGRRFLFVAMTRGGRCIRGEGPDDGAVFEGLLEAVRNG
jgi:hypothetical protein